MPARLGRQARSNHCCFARSSAVRIGLVELQPQVPTDDLCCISPRRHRDSWTGVTATTAEIDNGSSVFAWWRPYSRPGGRRPGGLPGHPNSHLGAGLDRAGFPGVRPYGHSERLFSTVSKATTLCPLCGMSETTTTWAHSSCTQCALRGAGMGWIRTACDRNTRFDHSPRQGGPHDARAYWCRNSAGAARCSFREWTP